MKNILFKILPLLAAVLFATSCGKDDDGDNSVVTDNSTTITDNTSTASDPVQVTVDEDGVPTIPFSITIGKGDESLSKAGMDATTLKQYFDDDDKIRITGKNISGELLKTASSGNNVAMFEGTLKGTGVTTIETDNPLLTAELIYPYRTTTLPLEEPQAWLSLQGYNSDGTDKLDYAAQQYGYLKNTFYYNDRNKGVTLKQYTAFLRIDLAHDANLFVEINGTKHTVAIKHGVHYVVAVPDGAKVYGGFLEEKTIDVSKQKTVHKIKRYMPSSYLSPGAFTVNSAGKQVLFCIENLAYTPQSGNRRFASGSDEPWSISNAGKDYDVGDCHKDVEWLDLFGLGTWQIGYKKPRGLSAEITSTNVDDYGWSFGTNGLADWGGGNDQDFRILTHDEWYYLLFSRKMPKTNDLRFTRASIQTSTNAWASGLIIFPDNFSVSSEWTRLSNEGASFSYNNITKSQWEELAEIGAVFLPAAGYREGRIIKDCEKKTYFYINQNQTYKDYMDDGSFGNYWGGKVDFYDKVGYLHFDKDEVKVNYSATDTYIGRSVRLVYDMVP